MYTLEDLRGKYVKVGTPEAEIFLDACNELGIRWSNGKNANEFSPALESFGLYESEIWQGNCAHWIKNGCSKFTPKPQWSIYTNYKPLCELSDEQAAALFNAWRVGGEFQYLSNQKWLDVGDSAFVTERDRPLRIKPKSERELFIDAAMELMTSETERTLEQQFGSLFDSGNFKLVKDGE